MTLRCLLVDDNPRFVEAARGLLERQGIRVVEVATTGAEACAKAALAKPDVILVDIGLSHESGFDVAAQLRDIPVILVSTQDPEDLADLLASSPALGFLPKSQLSGPAIRSILSEPRET